MRDIEKTMEISDCGPMYEHDGSVQALTRVPLTGNDDSVISERDNF